MVDLACYRKMNVYFFGNEAEKREFYLECICPFFSERKRDKYYATREWNGGANVEIVYEGEQIPKREMRKAITEYCKEKKLAWTMEEIEANLSSYKKNQMNLLQMEKKYKVEIKAENHLNITDRKLHMPYYQKVYNSSEHVKLHFESRFLLQPLIETALRKIKSKKEMNLFVMKLYQITMQLFEYGEKYASLMYVSNIMGVFGIAKQYGKEQAFLEFFENEYAKYDMSLLETMDSQKELVSQFEVAWMSIYEKCSLLVEENKLSEKGFYRLEEQEQQMRKNISGLESPFHKALYEDERLHDMVSSKTHLVFRSVVNIFYSIMPALNISFLDKNLCCYAIVRYIMEKYDTKWQQVMEERVI